MYEIGRMVRELQEARGWSQRELAERMETTQPVVGRLEAGGEQADDRTRSAGLGARAW